MKRYIYVLFTLSFISLGLSAQNLVLDKKYQIAFPDAGNSISSFFGSNRHDIFTVRESGEMFFLTTHYIKEGKTSKLYPTITMIDRNFNLVWNTEIIEKYSLQSYSMQFSEDGIELYSNMYRKSNNYGIYNNHPSIFNLSKSGELQSRNYNLSGDTLDHFTNKFDIINDAIEFIHSDSSYIYLSYMNFDDHKIFRSDTLLTMPQGDKVPYHITDWAYLDADNIIMVGAKSYNFILVYNLVSKDIISLDYPVLKNGNGINNIKLEKGRIYVYSSDYLAVIDRKSLDLINYTVPAKLVDRKYVLPSLTSVDVNENDEILLCIDTKLGSNRYYTMIKTDFNFEPIWEIEFPWICSGRYGTQARFLDNGTVALATVCDLSIRLQVFDNYPLGVNREQKVSGFNSYPNPASEYLNIKRVNEALTNEDAIFSIFNTLGVEMSTGGGAEIYGDYMRISVAHLPPGVYFISIGGMMQKFIKT